MSLRTVILSSMRYPIRLRQRILEQIAAQMQAKKLPMIVDLRDESDHENPIRLVLTPRSNRVNAQELCLICLRQLILKKTYRVNLNMIEVMVAHESNRCFDLGRVVRWRRRYVTRRLTHRLDQVMDRLHILEGYLIAYLNIDEVIRVIREEDAPKIELTKRFALSETQAIGPRSSLASFSKTRGGKITGRAKGT